MVREATEHHPARRRASTHAVPFAGFDGATFTNAPNAGAIFVALDAVRGARRQRAHRATTSSPTCAQRWPTIQEAFILVITPPPVRGIGTGGGFKMMVAGPARPRARRRSRRRRSELVAARQPGARPRRRLHAVQHRARPRSTPTSTACKAEMLGVPLERRVRDAAGLSRLGLRQRLQPARPHLPGDRAGRRRRSATSSRDIADLQDAQRRRRRWCRSARSRRFRDITGPYRVPRYNLYPGGRGPGRDRCRATRPARRSPRWSALAAEMLPRRLRLRMDRARLPGEARRQHRRCCVFVASRGVRVPGAGGAVRELVAAAGDHPDRADVPARRDHRRASCAGMDNNILTQIGFVVLVGLAAKNAILIVEFAKQARGAGRRPLRGRGRGGAHAAAADPDDLASPSSSAWCRW